MVASVAMGYGHLRAATALADGLGVAVTRVDLPPLATAGEALLWRLVRRSYERMSRLSQGRLAGPLVAPLLDSLTRIPEAAGPPHGRGTSARLLLSLIRSGLGRGMAAELRHSGRPLVTTFYAPAVAAVQAGVQQVLCVVTDTDLHPVWAPGAAVRGGVVYLAPTSQAQDRLVRYGVPRHRVLETGFPLPAELLGGQDLSTLRSDLARRLGRLDPHGVFLDARRNETVTELGAEPETSPEPLHLAVAVGGAGAQAAAVRSLLEALAPVVRHRRLRVTVVAGDHRHLQRRFTSWIRGARLDEVPRGVEVLYRDSFDETYRAFNRLLGEVDLLWTKPSELVFYAALGLPLLLAPPVGDHERRNAEWVVEAGTALPCPEPAELWPVLARKLAGGRLAERAWDGYQHLPRRGLYRSITAVKSLTDTQFTGS